MKQLALILFISVNILAERQDISEETIKYYENLITTGKAAAETYLAPQNAENDTDRSNKIKDHGTYDYIIVGAGSAGSVIAYRLSEIPNISILVIEAGDFENEFTDIPGMNPFSNSFYNWGFRSVPQKKSCLGKPENKCNHPRGRGYGGTSLINTLVYSRGEKKDYDIWGSKNPGWDYETVLEYYKKSENSHINGDAEYHSTGGFLNVEYSSYDDAHLNTFLKANQELGRQIVDYNGANALGVSPIQFTTLIGRRLSLGKAAIKPAQNRSNLHLSSNSYATKIGINPKNKKAYNVYFSKNKQNYMAKAKREIIISAGAIMSAHLLMLSGIGPKKHLKDKNITVVKDLEVGTKYRDHPAYFGFNILTNASLSLKPLRKYIKDYLNGTGVFTLPSNLHGLGFFKVNQASIFETDVEMILISPNRTMPRFRDEVRKVMLDGLDAKTTCSIYLAGLHPKSVGSIRLNSNNPFEYPLIDPQFYTDSTNYDIETMYKGIQLILELLKTDSFKKINGTLGKVVVPDCKNEVYLSKNFWLCTLRQLSDNFNHPMGTCPMGKNPKNGAVVDHKLKVHGIKNLRVADGSVIPHAIAAHTNAPCIMIGEQAADFIKKTLKRKLKKC